MDILQASETSHSKSSLVNFQHQYLPELLVNVYSYRLMVLDVVHVEGGFSQIWSHTSLLPAIEVDHKLPDTHINKPLLLLITIL